MKEKAIVYTVPEEQKQQSIETLKIGKKSLDYLRKNNFKTIQDVIDKQEELPDEVRGTFYLYIIFGVES